MGTTILLFLIPLLIWIGIAKLIYKHEFSFAEMGIQAAITGLVLIGLSFAGYHSVTSDTKIVNGVVQELIPRKESCKTYWSDSRDSFCTNQDTRRVKTGTQSCSTNSTTKVRTCRDNYKTQYRSEYPWERRYFVDSSIAKFEINRVDRQGVNTPPRFAEIQIGDAVSKAEDYTNYIKGSASTLFNQKLEEVPKVSYPEIFDYYRVNRVFYTDLPEPSFLAEWNKDIARLNSSLSKTEANVIINVTGKDQTWAEGLAQAWDAHNINDVVITIGASGEQISWVDVRSWSSSEMSDILLRDKILEIGSIDKDKINRVIEEVIPENFKVRDMKEFEYLAEDIPPPTWLLILAGIILIIISPAVSWYLSNNDQPSSFKRR